MKKLNKTKTKFIYKFLSIILINIILFEWNIPHIFAYSPKNNFEKHKVENKILIEKSYKNFPYIKTKKGKKIKVLITAYTSSYEETDSTPLITASGTYVRDGIVASNFLPFGTRIKIPNLFKDKIFVVQDRMHNKFKKRIDIWMLNKKDAINFGVKYEEIEIFLP